MENKLEIEKVCRTCEFWEQIDTQTSDFDPNEKTGLCRHPVPASVCDDCQRPTTENCNWCDTWKAKCPDLMLKKLNIDDGQMTMELESNYVLKILASHMGKFLQEHKAPNFVTMRMQDGDYTAFEVTVRKVSGETPAEQLTRAHARIKELEQGIKALRREVKDANG